MGKITPTQRSLLKIIATGPRDGFTPRFGSAHAKHQPNLMVMRSEGWITFSPSDPVLRITPAGRAALSQREGE